MSVSPTQDTLIVALEFKGKLEWITVSQFIMCSNATNNRLPRSRAISSGGHASRSFQHCNLKPRVWILTLS